MSTWFRHGRAWVLLAVALLPVRATAGPRSGLELAIQHATQDTDGALEPVGFPVSGSLTPAHDRRGLRGALDGESVDDLVPRERDPHRR